MRVRLTGMLVEVGEDAVVIERDGIGYEVLVPGYALGELAACRGREITLHTLEFLEGNPAQGNLTPRLIGFVHPEDKIFFQRFISVKSIGARKALKALREPVGLVAGWIESGDVKLLTRLPGIGARAAEMIVAELRGKLSDVALVGAGARAVDVGQWTEAQRDALEVLVAWGDSRADSERWLERAAQLHSNLAEAEDWVTAAYRVKTGGEG